MSITMKAQWMMLLMRKSNYEAALTIIGRLAGYRNNSLHAMSDVDTLANALDALVEMRIRERDERRNEGDRS
jgi:hypothetical protein